MRALYAMTPGASQRTRCLGSGCCGEARHGNPIHVDAEARILRDAYAASVVLERLHKDGLAERMLGAVELQHRLERSMAWRGVRQHGQQLQGGRKADAAAPYVRHVAHAECRRHVGNLLALRKTASGTSVRLQYVNGAPGEHLAEAPAREFAFPTRDGDRLAAAHLH